MSSSSVSSDGLPQDLQHCPPVGPGVPGCLRRRPRRRPGILPMTPCHLIEQAAHVDMSQRETVNSKFCGSSPTELTDSSQAVRTQEGAHWRRAGARSASLQPRLWLGGRRTATATHPSLLKSLACMPGNSVTPGLPLGFWLAAELSTWRGGGGRRLRGGGPPTQARDRRSGEEDHHHR